MGQDVSENYIKTTVPQDRTTDINTLPEAKKITNINYFDGLGRPSQSIAVRAGGTNTASSVNHILYDWESGLSTTPAFRGIGQPSENLIVNGTTPFGDQDLLWQCGNDAESDADGGWHTSRYGIDKTKTYRYSVWVKRTISATNGRVYIGTKNVSSLDGIPNSNPYFWHGFLPQIDTWYLMVGIVHPHDYTGSDIGESGVYDINGNKIMDGTEFKWNADTSNTYFRNYLYYSTDTNVRQYFWSPLLQIMDGNELTLIELGSLEDVQIQEPVTQNNVDMMHSSGDIITPFEYDEYGRQTIEYLPFSKSDNNGMYVEQNIALSLQEDFYLEKFSGDLDTNAPNAYSQNIIENSPLNRILETCAPGEDWSFDSNNVWNINHNETTVDTSIPLQMNDHSQSIDHQDIVSTTTGGGSTINISITSNVLSFSCSAGFNPAPLDTGALVAVTTYPYTIYDMDLGQLSDNSGPIPYFAKIEDGFFTITSTNPSYLVSSLSYSTSIPIDYSHLGNTVNYTERQSTNNSIRFQYHGNSNNFPGPDYIKKFSASVTLDSNGTYSPSLVYSDHYSSGELQKTITKDENWQPTKGKDHTVEEYKNSLGQVVLKRTYSDQSPLDTYYIYDDYNNLTYVLPPKIDAGFVSLQDITNDLDELGYQYIYDHRNRLVEKKIPGKGWEYIVYDDLNRPVLTQDAIQRAKSPQEWLFTKYDTFGRVAYTGLYRHNEPRWAVQGHVERQTGNQTGYLYEEFSSSATAIFNDPTTVLHYTNRTFPYNLHRIYTINYYDNYAFDLGNGTTEDAYGVTPIANAKGLPTGTKVRVLETNQWISSVSYYDVRARLIYAYSHNSYLGTTDKIKSLLDFTGKALETTSVHSKTDQPTDITTVETNTYDHMGRLVTQSQRINDGSEELIAKNTYDNLGQLATKTVGGTVEKQAILDNEVGISVTGNVITKTDPDGWNSGFSTQQVITGDGYISYKTNSTTPVVMVGLSYTDADQHYSSINYALYNSGNNVYVIENGYNHGHMLTATAGDTFSVRRTGKAIQYLRNDEVFYTSSVPTANLPMVGDVSMMYTNRSIEDVKVASYDGLQQIDYTYNIRGWLKQINDVDNIDVDLFAFKINYNKPQLNHTVNGNTTPLYNGNISETIWKTANDVANVPTGIDPNTYKRGYTYNYDALNRITSAWFTQLDQYSTITPVGSNFLDYSLNNVNYDKNGNIENLTRNANYSYSPIDVLAYNYDDGNKLLKVTDNATSNKSEGFNDGYDSPTLDDYAYDANGNMIEDKNKGMYGIDYNHLNLPKYISSIGNASGFGNIVYVYDATGVKQRKIVNNWGAISTTTTDYAGNYIYENTGSGAVLKFFSHAEGYAEPDVSGGYSYVYQYKDHLGNIRLAYADTDRNGSIDSNNEILEENNYYPLGLKHKGYNNIVSANSNSVARNFTYLGQEEQNELGLNWLTFRYRNYMPDIGRFFGVDPISEEFMSISTYQIAHNNPIWKIEIEGLEGETIQGEDIQHNEPVKVEKARGNPWVTMASEGKVVQETVKQVVKKPSWGSKLINLGTKTAGLTIGALLNTWSLDEPQPTDFMPQMQFDEDGVIRTPIDENLRVDDRQLKVEGDNDSPVIRLKELDKVSSPCDAPNGCEDVADALVSELGDGAQFLQITPRIGNLVGDIGGENPGWAWHVAATKDGMVYDRLTGKEGMKLDDYKKLYDDRGFLNFDIVNERTLK